VSLCIWRGPSFFTGRKVGMYLSEGPSDNPATGTDVLQVYFESTESIGRKSEDCCWKCPEFIGRSCYVGGYQGPTIFKTAKDYTYPGGLDDAIARVKWFVRMVRIGADGDPACLPAEGMAVLRELLRKLAVPFTGYTHFMIQRPELVDLCMASCSNLKAMEVIKKHVPNASTFRKVQMGETIMPSEKICAKIFGGSCNECTGCSGAGSVNTVMPAHGPSEWARGGFKGQANVEARKRLEAWKDKWLRRGVGVVERRVP